MGDLAHLLLELFLRLENIILFLIEILVKDIGSNIVLIPLVTVLDEVVDDRVILNVPLGLWLSNVGWRLSWSTSPKYLADLIMVDIAGPSRFLLLSLGRLHDIQRKIFVDIIEERSLLYGTGFFGLKFWVWEDSLFDEGVGEALPKTLLLLLHPLRILTLSHAKETFRRL